MRGPKVLLTLLAFCLVNAPRLLAQQSLPPELVSYPDVVLHNGKVVTADEKFTIAEAVAIRDGKFLAVGTNQRILAMAGPQTKKYDLQGRSALPGFIDTHLHQAWVEEPPLAHGQSRQRPEFETVQSSIEELKKIVAAAAPGEFIALMGPSNKVVCEDLNVKILDDIAPKNPLYIEASNDQVVANSLALKMLLESHPNVPGVLKGKDGKPTGQLRGAASGEMVWVLKPWPKVESLYEPQKASLARHNQLGLTTIEGRASPLSLTVLRDLYTSDQLTARVRIYHEFIRQNSEPERFLKRIGNLTGVGSDMFKIVGTTVQVVDGGGNASARTEQPKFMLPADAPYTANGQNKWEETGDLSTSDRRNIILANRYGWTIGAMHSSGDASNRILLEVYHEAHKERSLLGRHWGLDHGEQLTAAHYPLLKEMGIVPSIYSKVIYNNAQRIKVYGKDDVFKQQPVKSMITYGLRPAAESDANGAQAAPLFNMKNWITRIDETGWQLDPTEKASRQEALYMYTLWAAAYTGEEKLMGSIEPGKLADIIVTGGDYMTFPEKELDKLRVVLTIVGGKTVYEAKGSF